MSVWVGVGAFAAAFVLSKGMEPTERWAAIILTTLLVFLVSLSIIPVLVDGVRGAANKVSNRLFVMPLQDIVSSVIGLIVGLVIASLLNTVINKIPIIGPYLGVVSLIFFGYLGISVAYRKRSELFSIFNFRHKNDKSAETEKAPQFVKPKVLDTSVIIDGRITDVCRTGFVEGDLIIANFVLDELRHIADSADILKRNRGRRGLDILNRLRKDLPERVIITDTDYPEITEVDSKLVKLAQDMNAMVLTNDFNLNKVAQVQNVPVLNLNELSNALKPVVLPGETMDVEVIREGKEQNQGLAYLDDGTMIVIENGKKYIGQNIRVEVSSVLQTSAGRMIFVRLARN